MTTRRFARTTSKLDKLVRDTSDVARIPISIRSSISLDPDFEDRIRTQLASRVGHSAEMIERGTVRFEDVNGPKGGVDTTPGLDRLCFTPSDGTVVQREARHYVASPLCRIQTDPAVRPAQWQRDDKRLKLLEFGGSIHASSRLESVRRWGRCCP